MADNIFEVAVRVKLRFNTSQGQLSAEELYDLPLTSDRKGVISLDSLAQTTNEALERAGSLKSFVKRSRKSKEETLNELRLDILKAVIAYKIDEEEKREKAAENSLKREKFLAILEKKEAAALENMSAEELRASISALE